METRTKKTAEKGLKKKKHGGYHNFYTDMVKEFEFTNEQLYMLLIINYLEKSTGKQVFASVKYLAEHTGLRYNQANAQYKNLVDRGYVIQDTKQGRGYSNLKSISKEPIFAGKTFDEQLTYYEQAPDKKAIQIFPDLMDIFGLVLNQYIEVCVMLLNSDGGVCGLNKVTIAHISNVSEGCVYGHLNDFEKKQNRPFRSTKCKISYRNNSRDGQVTFTKEVLKKFEAEKNRFEKIAAKQAVKKALEEFPDIQEKGAAKKKAAEEERHLAARIWKDCLAVLSSHEVDRQTLNLFKTVKGLKYDLETNTITLGVQSERHLKTIENEQNIQWLKEILTSQLDDGFSVNYELHRPQPKKQVTVTDAFKELEKEFAAFFFIWCSENHIDQDFAMGVYDMYITLLKRSLSDVPESSYSSIFARWKVILIQELSDNLIDDLDTFMDNLKQSLRLNRLFVSV